jgi:type I restriction enzyme S subunit
MSMPALRFKDENGKDYPDWEESTYGKIISQKSKKFDPAKSKEHLKCIELEHLSQSTGRLLGFTDALNQKSIKNRFNEGEILFGKLRPYLKKYLKAPFDGVCSTEIWVLSGIKVSNDFLYQFVQTDNFLRIANISSGSKMPRADWNVIESGEIQFPAKEEQKKITNFLTEIDKKISQLAQKNELLIRYKKSVLQKILSQELRFKDNDGNYYPKWVQKNLSEIALCVKKSKEIPSQFFYIDLTSVKKGKLINPVFFQKKEAPLSAKKLPLYNDILFQTVRPYQKNNLHFKLKDGYVCSSAYVQLRSKEDPDFLFQVIHDDNFVNEVNRRATGSTYPVIKEEALMGIRINIPSKYEQIKIAKFLSAIDEKITLVQSQLDLARKYKQGLLQQMFV